MYDPKPTLVPSALIGSILANLFRKHVARLQDNEKQAESVSQHLRSAKPALMLPAKWSGKMSRRMHTE